MNARLRDTEFGRCYPLDTRTDDERSDAFSACVESKFKDPEWLRDAFGEATFDKTAWQLFAEGDYLAFCQKANEAMLKQARDEAGVETQ